MKTTGEKVTQKTIAKSAHIGPDFLSHIVHGRRRCPPAVALRLEKITGISRVTWVWGEAKEIREAVREYINPMRCKDGY